MSNITYIKRWVLHLSGNDDWEALCGEPDPGFLADGPEKVLPGYEVCEACQRVRDLIHL